MTDLDQAARDLLSSLRRGDQVVCIHYACENFFQVKDRPVAVTAIGWSELAATGNFQEELVFSIANSAPSDDVTDRERDLLTRFFEHARTAHDPRFVHWNMNSSTFGFAAIVARYRYLFGSDPPVTFLSDRLFDLDAIIENRFGGDFAKHPKFRSLCNLNGFYMPAFQPGIEEAKAIEGDNYGLIERSTAEKAHLIGLVLMRLATGRLRTQNSVGAVTFAGEHLDAVSVVLALGQRFLYVERELKRRRENRPTLTVTDEYDAQDLLRSMLALFFDDVRPEDATPQYAGAASRVDFVLPDFGLAVELKYARESLDDKKLGEELIVDRDRYASRDDVRHLVCLVFDHEGRLRNPRGLENDLGRDTSTDQVAVTVRIYDR